MVISKEENGANKMYIDWIRSGLSKPGKDRTGLAAAMGVAPSQVSRILKNMRKIAAVELAPISAYLESPLPHDGIWNGVGTAPVLGDVGGRIWCEMSMFDALPKKAGAGYPPVPAIPLDDFAGSPQFAVRVVSDSVGAAIPEGYFAICVPYARARKAPVSGDIVVVDIERNGLFHPAILRMVMVRDQWELRTAHREGGEPDRVLFQFASDLKHDRDKARAKDQVSMKGLVLGKYAPV